MPDLTREKFVEHPVYGRVYRSGDFGRLLPDGSLAFVGRRDDLVKLRGQRIELGEVNRAILQSERVKGCTTMICKDKNTDAQLLVSFWVPAVIDRSDVLKDSDISARLTKDLFDTITKLLPTYMVPSFLFPRAHIPMTVNGKVDKYLLTEVFQNATPQYLNLHSFHFDKAGITDGIEKFSELELKISRCVASVTQSPEASIGRHTSFYSLGMDSILAISFSRQLKVEGLGQVDVSTTMKNDTVARLAASIERNNKVKTKRQDCLPEMEKLFSSEFVDEVRQRVHKAGKRTKRILPCTPLQEAMLSHMVTKDCDSYLNHLIFEIIGDRDRLKAAWFAVIERHDILRSWFLPTPDPRFSFAQVVLDAIDIPWNVTECSNTDMKSRIEHQKGSIFPAGDCTVPYAFTEFCNLTTGKSELHLFMHHALYDGEAMAQLLQEVEQSFFGLQLAPVVSFDSYLELVLNTNIEAEDRFWKNYLTGVSPTYISVLQSNNTSSDSGTHNFYTHLGIPLTRVIEYCRNCSVTLLNLLQAAWAKLLFAYTGESDICFGNVFSSRALSVEGAKRIIGPCFNTLPLRVKLNKNTANSELMLQLRETKADMLSYQLTSLRRIQSLFGSDTSRLFDTLLLLQKAPQSLNGEIWKFVAESGSMGFPIVCEICPDYNNDMLSFCLHYEGSKTLTPDGLQMLEGYMETIRHTIEYPGARAADRSIVKSGVPSFISFSKPSATENHQSRELEEWSAEALEIRELLSCLSKVETKSISLSTTIYKLGLDSINAIQIAADLRKRGYDISAADILEVSTGITFGRNRMLNSIGAHRCRDCFHASTIHASTRINAQRNLQAV